MNPISELTFRALGGETAGLHRYSAALRRACVATDPPYGRRRYGEIYRTAAADPRWLAASLILNAEREAEGATRLWSLAACTAEAEVREQVKSHAIDESRHSRWYLALLDATFPDALEPPLREHLDGVSPRFSADHPLKPLPGSPYAHPVTLDDLVQMNIAEIRTAVNQQLQRPVLLAHCRPERRARITPILDRLLHDEWRHVAYSAALIERFAGSESDDHLTDLVTMRMRDFNRITEEEVEQGIFEST